MHMLLGLDNSKARPSYLTQINQCAVEEKAGCQDGNGRWEIFYFLFFLLCCLKAHPGSTKFKCLLAKSLTFLAKLCFLASGSNPQYEKKSIPFDCRQQRSAYFDGRMWKRLSVLHHCNQRASLHHTNASVNSRRMTHSFLAHMHCHAQMLVWQLQHIQIKFKQIIDRLK